jgi:hypothetical protein
LIPLFGKKSQVLRVEIPGKKNILVRKTPLLLGMQRFAGETLCQQCHSILPPNLKNTAGLS